MLFAIWGPAGSALRTTGTEGDRPDCNALREVLEMQDDDDPIKVRILDEFDDLENELSEEEGGN